MREIKFRAKISGQRRRGEWAYGEFAHDDIGNSFIHFWKDDAEYPHWTHNSVDESTLGQFTGLLDKNGREIYEHDWVACANGSMGVIEYVDKDMAFKIATGKYDKEGGWTHPIEGFDAATLEVIGNLYEGKTR